MRSSVFSGLAEFSQYLKLCGLECSFVSEHFATFCACIETLIVLKLKEVLIWQLTYSGGCGSPAGSQRGDERKKLRQYVEAGSPTEVTYERW